MKSLTFLCSRLVLILLALQTCQLDVAAQDAATVEVGADGNAAPETNTNSCQEVCASQISQAVHQVTQQKEHWEGLFHTVKKESDSLKTEKEALQTQISQLQTKATELESKLVTLEQDSESRITTLQQHLEEFQSHAAEAKDLLDAAHETHKNQVEEAKRSVLARLADANEQVTLLEKQLAETQEQLRQHKESRFHINFQGIIQDLVALVKGKAIK